MKKKPVIVALSVFVLMFASVPCVFAESVNETLDEAIARTVCLPMNNTATYTLSQSGSDSYYATRYNGSASSHEYVAATKSRTVKSATFSKSANNNSAQCHVTTSTTTSPIGQISETKTSFSTGRVFKLGNTLKAMYWTP